MKKLALVLFAGISFATAHAQVQFGIKAGGNFATQTGSDAGDSKTLFNFNGGVFLKLPVVPGFAIQPELVYSGQGAHYNIDGSNYHANYLNIPILFKWTARTGPYFETGPQIGFLLSAHHNLDGVSYDEKRAYKSSEIAWVFGVGYKVPHSPVGIDLRYNIGLTNVEDNSYTGLDGTIHNNVLQLGLTYVLFDGPRR